MERIDELEVKIAYQDQLIAELDGVVRELGDEVARLRHEIKEIRAQVAEGSTEGQPNKLEDEVPPHY